MVLSSNAGASSMGNVKKDELDTDVLIIGGGVAATFAAIKAREQGTTVTLVDKGYVGRSGLTPYFHGFAYYDPNDPKKPRQRTGSMALCGQQNPCPEKTI